VGGIFAASFSRRLTLNGSISGVGRGLRGGTGGVDSVVGAQGENINGIGGGSSSANANGGGGGTNLGGNGSGATTTVGTADLSTMLMGGGGGGANVPSGQTAVNGGAGGGIVFIWARELDITGSINVNGAAGGSGYRASGAGAGGSVLIFAERIIRLGSNAITALGGAATSSSNGGGTGGGGSHATSGTSGTNSGGGAGGNGRIAIAKCSIDDAGTTNPTYHDRGYQTYCGIIGRD
jgi:large repetitive protein